MAFRNVVMMFLLAGTVFQSDSTGQTRLSDSERKSIEEAIQNVNDRVVQAAEQMDVEQMFSFIREDVEGVMIRNGRLILTKDEAYRAYKQDVQNLRKLEYRFDRTVIHVLSREFVLFVCEGVSTGTTGQGDTFQVPFAQTTLYGFRDGAWKALHVHSSVPSGR